MRELFSWNSTPLTFAHEELTSEEQERRERAEARLRQLRQRLLELEAEILSAPDDEESSS